MNDDDLALALEDYFRSGAAREDREAMNMSTPLLQSFQVGDKVDFTIQRIGRLCRASGDKVEVCPACKRRAMRLQLMNWKVRYIHWAQVGDINIIPLDACTMWPRTEYKLKYGSDSIHPKFRHPGDEDGIVEVI